MKHRLFFTIAVLVASMLTGCNLPGFEEQPDKLSSPIILSVEVNPPAGSGSFTLEVAYDEQIIGSSPYQVYIYCNYVSPDGATMSVDSFYFFAKRFSTSYNHKRKRLPFSVTQADGVTKPGTYTAGCGAEGGNILTTTFKVVGKEEQSNSFSKVLNVAVTPPSGSGSFTLDVTYEAYPSFTIHCNYVSPDGATTALGDIVPTYANDGGATKTERLAFNVTQPGAYLAGCSSAADNVPVTTTFTVTGGAATASVTPTAEAIQPIQIKGTGQKTTSKWDFQPNYCTTAADLVLTVIEDRPGKLEITGDAFYDHINCLGGIGWEKWLVTGAANVANETVSFMSCSYGDTDINQFNAQGIISYSGGVLSGEVTCLGKTGSEAGKVVTIIKAP